MARRRWRGVGGAAWWRGVVARRGGAASRGPSERRRCHHQRASTTRLATSPASTTSWPSGEESPVGSGEVSTPARYPDRRAPCRRRRHAAAASVTELHTRQVVGARGMPGVQLGNHRQLPRQPGGRFGG
ncbi:MAG TPA: hypothetical protein VGH72_32460 [Pseudonocardia sp.]